LADPGWCGSIPLQFPKTLTTLQEDLVLQKVRTRQKFDHLHYFTVRRGAVVTYNKVIHHIVKLNEAHFQHVQLGVEHEGVIDANIVLSLWQIVFPAEVCSNRIFCNIFTCSQSDPMLKYHYLLESSAQLTSHPLANTIIL